MTRDKNVAPNSSLNSTLESLRRFLETQSQANLLAGLLTEASLVSEPNRLEPLRDLIGAARRKIEANLSLIDNVPQRKKLVELYKQLGDIGSDEGIIGLRG